ncbi:MAG: Uma2 family endonuclease [Candidatus Kapaibacteriota bacterium]
MNTQLLQTALKMPDAALFLSELQKALQEENAKRLHFYNVIDENKKMEFINGVIVFHSPVMKRHNNATGLLYSLMNMYAELTEQGFVGIEKIMISLTRNDYEPDICFFPESLAKTFTETQMQFPAPTWIVEVLSKSTAKNDRTVKFQDYAAHGVREYWIIDPDTGTVEQYSLRKGKYDLLLKAKDGMISSLALKGFSIPIRAIFHRKENSIALRQMLEKSK